MQRGGRGSGGHRRAGPLVGDRHAGQHRRQFDAPAGQALLQQLAGVGQPAGDRALLPAQLLGRLLLAPRLQAAEDERPAVLLRQAVQFLIEDGLQFAPAQVRRGGTLRGGGRLGLMAMTAGCGPACFHGDPVGDTVEPAGDGTLLAYRAGLACQNEERGLVSVLGILLMPQDVATDAEHEPAVALHQGGERRLVALGGEAPQRLAVTELTSRLGVEYLAQVLQERAHLLAGHDSPRMSFPR